MALELLREAVGRNLANQAIEPGVDRCGCWIAGMLAARGKLTLEVEKHMISVGQQSANGYTWCILIFFAHLCLFTGG